MGDSPPASELSCTERNEWARLLKQDGSAERTQVQTWAPTPTAFDSIESMTMDTAEDEKPTRPVTPSRIVTENQDSPASDGDMNCDTDLPSLPSIAHAQIRLLPKNHERAVSAGKPNCGICGADLAAVDRLHRVDHFNQCWSKHYDVTVNGPTEADEPTNICILCNTVLEDLASIDAFEHRISCLKSHVPLPTSCPRCNIRFDSNGVLQSLVRIAEHLYVCSVRPEDETFAEVQNHWCERQNKRMNPGSCAFCSKALADLNAADALHHRRNCFERAQPTHCPICSVTLPRLSSHCTLEDILWHVYNCQHDKKLSVIDKYDHKMLEIQVAGRIHLICGLISSQVTGVSTIGPRNNWGHKEHAKSYRRKMAAARENGFGPYLAASTNLRAVATHTEDDRIMLMQRVKITAAKWIELQLFCRSAYCGLTKSKASEMCTRLMVEYETHEVVHNWHAELEMPTDSTSCTTSSTFSNKRFRRIQSQTSDVVSKRTPCRHAVETARATGIPIPPGFDSEVGELE